MANEKQYHHSWKEKIFYREQSSTDAGDDQNKLREASWKIEIYMNVEEEEGSSVEKEPFKGGQRQLSDGCWSNLKISKKCSCATDQPFHLFRLNQCFGFSFLP